MLSHTKVVLARDLIHSLNDVKEGSQGQSDLTNTYK